MRFRAEMTGGALVIIHPQGHVREATLFAHATSPLVRPMMFQGGLKRLMYLASISRRDCSGVGLNHVIRQ